MNLVEAWKVINESLHKDQIIKCKSWKQILDVVSNMSNCKRLGIDLGGVAIDRQYELNGVNIWKSNNYKNAPWIKDCKEALLLLKKKDIELFVISKSFTRPEILKQYPGQYLSTEEKRKRSLGWMQYNKFYNIIPQKNIHFVERRDQKGNLASQLKLDVFVDDNIEVIDHLVGDVLAIHLKVK